MIDVSNMCEEDEDSTVKMMEIAENLHRSELTTQQRNEHLAQWVSLLEKFEVPNSSAERPSSKPGPKPSSAVAAVAKASGLTTNEVKRAIKTTKVAPAVKAAADDAKLSQKQRLTISRMPEADQLEGVAKLAAINIVADRTEQTAAAKAPKPSACDEMPDVETPPWTSAAEQRRFNFIYRASEAIAYGKQNGFQDAEVTEITSEIIKAAMEAAEVWSDLTSALRRRVSGEMEDFPEFLKRAGGSSS